MDDQPAAGELVTEMFEYDGDRQVTVYVPPGPPEAVVFAGDGQLISQRGGVPEAQKRHILLGAKPAAGRQ